MLDKASFLFLLEVLDKNVRADLVPPLSTHLDKTAHEKANHTNTIRTCRRLKRHSFVLVFLLFFCFPPIGTVRPHPWKHTCGIVEGAPPGNMRASNNS